MTRPIGVGIIGLGFMGRTHLAAYAAAAAAGFDNRLVAVCDADARRRAGDLSGGGNLATGAVSFDPGNVRAVADPSELLRDPDVDLVSICTPTDSHVDLSVAALADGKHVLVEKPVALAPADARRLLAASRGASTLCMPAHCMRFWPSWSWLRERVKDGTLGAVESATFERLGTRPTWNAFYADSARSGGALVDLHLHDADFVRFCFGDPTEVYATGTLDHVTAAYRFPSGPPHVTAEGGWNHAPGFAFRMRFTVVFERATADFELGRDPELRLSRDGRSEAVAVPAINGYDGEVRHLLAAIRDGRRDLAVGVGDAVRLAELLAAERKSLESGAPVRVPAT